MLTANHNSERRFDPDYPESGRLYKPAGSSIQQDSAFKSSRNSFWPLLTCSSVISSRLLLWVACWANKESTFDWHALWANKESITHWPTREERIAGGLRPGPVQPHSRADHLDMRLQIDVAPAAESHADRLPRVMDIPESGKLEPARRPESPPGMDLGCSGVIPEKGPGIALQRYTSPGSAHHTPATGVNNVLPLPCEQKKS